MVCCGVSPRRPDEMVPARALVVPPELVFDEELRAGHVG